VILGSTGILRTLRTRHHAYQTTNRLVMYMKRQQNVPQGANRKSQMDIEKFQAPSVKEVLTTVLF